ncbi:(deoxy)nucleoside triphosphate pyrophosphohydrolase [Aestuariimicrobium kwangyangense]|uniref:(deoxy)nucleoside triphosphate pyrophosphohydrolase n=1 Tax=Aestuariimicrobium kwangyangense TaxID=396389 RepID=UPI0003B7707B|nr:(deoxy)nucleoside triphosphate pyrophosphohydrolase [Aestuariimicrobium kwangyangense]
MTDIDGDHDPRGIVVAGLVVRDGRLLAAQRAHPPELAGRWEFPGGKVEVGESPGLALARELREELGVEVQVGDEFPNVDGGRWPINHRWAMRAYWCTVVAGEPRAIEHSALTWLDADSPHPDWLPADVALARAACTRLWVS